MVFDSSYRKLFFCVRVIHHVLTGFLQGDELLEQLIFPTPHYSLKAKTKAKSGFYSTKNIYEEAW